MGWEALEYTLPHTLHQKPVSRQGNILDHRSCKNILKLPETKSISCVCVVMCLERVHRSMLCLFLCEFIFVCL